MKKKLIYYADFPPTGIDFDSWNKRTADKHFNWFVEQVPIRIEYLKKRISVDLEISPECLDFSEESLDLVWEWFLNVAVIEKTSRKQIKQMKKTETYKIIGESFINRHQLSLNTLIILRDIGIYLAQTFIFNFPTLRWSYVHNKPSAKIKDINNNKPILIGFTEHGYSLDFEPIHMVNVLGSKLLTQTHSRDDLKRLYILWKQNA